MIIIVTLITIFNTMTSLDNTVVTDSTSHKPHPQPDDRRISSKSLLGAEGRIIIEHDGQHYLLRQTHAGKLILTK
ncbi:hemin uptake protein HemP [Enterobacter sp. CC120223-11]|uniref:hemin uptake protein HemP n=1 Tax=Enterobacter sp. CC120223-11 TaxID=1378073 RepID=UPI000BD8B11B|nr:hemin uptake protein HemP [Enterobacter sp. CC120223-11]SNY74742.1 Hemin uptake protein HemP [Enterobacter sp. CC120223-11]